MMMRLSGRLALTAFALSLVVGSAVVGSAVASPTGDTVFVSTINLPVDFGRPVTYDEILGTPNGWDLTMGSGVPMTVGTPLVTNGIEISLRSTSFAGIPGGIEIINDEGVPIQADFFEMPGEIVETSFIMSPPNQSFSMDPFATYGFLIEDVTWRQKNGTPLNLPVTLYDGSVFLEFTTTGGSLIDLDFLAAFGLISLGPHPLHPDRTVIYLSDSQNDLDDVTVYPTGNVLTDAALIEDEFTAGILDAILGVPVTGFNIGQFYVATVPGDANGDRLVTGADYTVWADHFGQMVDPLTNGDFNNDGLVTGADYTIWADNFGFIPSPPAAVPEPSSLLLGALALAGLAWRARRSS